MLLGIGSVLPAYTAHDGSWTDQTAWTGRTDLSPEARTPHGMFSRKLLCCACTKTVDNKKSNKKKVLHFISYIFTIFYSFFNDQNIIYIELLQHEFV